MASIAASAAPVNRSPAGRTDPNRSRGGWRHWGWGWTTGWSPTCFLRVGGEAEAPLAEHLRLPGQQQVARLFLHPVKLSALVIVRHVQGGVVPVDRLCPVLLPSTGQGEDTSLVQAPREGAAAPCRALTRGAASPVRRQIDPGVKGSGHDDHRRSVPGLGGLQQVLEAFHAIPSVVLPSTAEA